MYQQICDFFQGIPFFSSAAFGIIAMLIHGGSWSLTGFFLGNAPRKGFEAAVMISVGNFLTFIFSICVLVITKAYSTSDLLATMWTCLAFFVNGILIFGQQKLVSVSMQQGPNGVIWAINQSALICPFLMGVVLFNNEVNTNRWMGVAFMIAALVLFAFSKDNTSKGGSMWKYLAFISFAVTGLQQSVISVPSYYPVTFGVTGAVKSIAQSSGILLAFSVWMLLNDRQKSFQDIKNAFRNRTFWKYITISQIMDISGAYLLLYPGLNIMTKAGLGSMCYPMLVGACIIAFSLISLTVLKEKISFIQVAAVAACIGGLCLMCLK